MYLKLLRFIEDVLISAAVAICNEIERIECDNA